MEKQISIAERILECEDYVSLCIFTSSHDFKFSTKKFHHFYFSAFKDFVNSISSFLYVNDLMPKSIYLTPIIESSTLRFEIELNMSESTPKGYIPKNICTINVDKTFNFCTILNRVLFSLKNHGFIDALPF